MVNHDAFISADGDVSMSNFAHISTVTGHVVAHLKELTSADLVESWREAGLWVHEEALADLDLVGGWFVADSGQGWEGVAAWWDLAVGVSGDFVAVDPFDDGGGVGAVWFAHLVVDFAVEGSEETLGLAVVPRAQLHGAEEVIFVAVNGDSVSGGDVDPWSLADNLDLAICGLVWQFAAIWHSVDEDTVFVVNLDNNGWKDNGQGALISQEGEVSVDKVTGQDVCAA